MKKILGMILCAVMIMGNIFAQYSAMTYNIRYSTPNDEENWWENRKEWVADLIRFYEPDVFGIQEGLDSQVQFLDSALSEYKFVGVGRDDGKKAGEYSALFYKPDLVEVLDSGTFWLSETPDKVSVGWDASMERISTWAKLKIKRTGQEYFVFNAHLDHRGPESRLNAVKLIYEIASEKNKDGLPLIVMGDLNATPHDPPIKYLSSVMSDSRLISENPPYGPEGTFNGFDTSRPLNDRIDHIFVNEMIKVQKYAVITDTRDLRTPSDHLPVYIEFRLN